MKRIILAAAVLFGLNSAHAQSDMGPIQKNHCDFFEAEGLKTILVPLDHSQEFSTRELAYGYQFIENLIGESNPKTLIYLTGGPGAGSIGQSGSSFFDKILSVGFNLILIDPRGVACNGLDYGEIPDEVITSEQTALDIIEIIKAEGLKDYIIMGQSYGTMLSTVLTSKINQTAGLEQPELLILEGTFGRHLETGLEYQENMVKIFREEMPKHFPTVEDLFFSGAELELPFGLPLAYWTNILVSYATLGVETFALVNPDFVRLLDGYPDSLNDEGLKTYFSSDYNDYLDFFSDESLIEESDILPSIQFNYVYYSIMCKEMSPQDVNLGEIIMIGGELVVTTRDGADVCSAFKYSDKPYDSANYRLSTKTLYFQGTSDGQTPKHYFEHHFNNNLADKEAVQVAGGGHGLFYTDLEVCSAQIWTQIKLGSTDFTNVLDQDGYCLRPDEFLSNQD